MKNARLTFSTERQQHQLLHETTLLKASEGLSSVTALACSPNGSRVCVATTDRTLRFLGGPVEVPSGLPSYTEEVFVTRAADKGKPHHLVTGLAFSADGSQVAVAQSDGVVHVYGVNSEGRRRICCRLPLGCTATCLAWAKEGNNLLFIGLISGRVRVADVAANKLGTLHEAHSPVTSLACTQDGALVVAGHRSGQVLLHLLAASSPSAALRSLAVLEAPVSSVQIRSDAVACAAANVVLILGLDGTVLQEAEVQGFGALLAWHPTAPYLAVAVGEELLLLLTPHALRQPHPSRKPHASPERHTHDACTGRNESILVEQQKPAAATACMRCSGAVATTALMWEGNNTSLCFATARGSVERVTAHKLLSVQPNRLQLSVNLCNTIAVRCSSSQNWAALHREEDDYEYLQLLCPLLHQQLQQQEQMILAVTAQCTVGVVVGPNRVYRLQQRAKGDLHWLGEQKGSCLFHEAGAAIEGEAQIIVVNAETGEKARYATASPPTPELLGLQQHSNYGLVLAHLVDKQTIRVLAISTGEHVTNIRCDVPPVWFSVTEEGVAVLLATGGLHFVYFNDKTKSEGHQQKHHLILKDCQHAEMLQHSCLLVAQQNSTICVWYNITCLNDIEVLQLKGRLVRLEVKAASTGRNNNSSNSNSSSCISSYSSYIDNCSTKNSGRAINSLNTGNNSLPGGTPCEVYVVVETENAGEKQERLSPLRLQFESCLLRQQYEQAALLLRELPETSVSCYLWKRLEKAALGEETVCGLLSELQRGGDTSSVMETVRQRVAVAAAAAAAAADAANAAFLNDLQQTGFRGGGASFAAHLAVFSGKFEEAQKLLMQRRETDTLQQLQQQLHRWQDWINLLEQQEDPRAADAKKEFKAFLLAEHRYEEAAAIAAAERNSKEAVELFLKARVPLRAAAYIFSSLPAHPLTYSSSSEITEVNDNDEVSTAENYASLGGLETVDTIANELKEIELTEKAAELYRHVGQWTKALSLYQQGRNYAKAVELAENVSPDLLPQLHAEWATDCLHRGEAEAAVLHFTAAGCGDKAVEACVRGGLLRQARQLLKVQKGPLVPQQLLSLGKQLEEAGDLSEAEEAYLDANAATRAVKMRMDRGHLAAALKVAHRAAEDKEMKPFLQRLAKQLAANKKFKDAEALLLAVGDLEGALHLMQAYKQFDRLLLLLDSVSSEKREILCKRMANQLRSSKCHQEAERLFLACGAWQEAADMYREEGEWVEAERVAVAAGGAAAGTRMKILHAREILKTQSPEAAVQMLLKRGEHAAAVDLAVEAEAFDLAAETAELHCSDKIAEVHVQLGRHREAAGQLREAEEAYLKAQCPAAAVALYRKRGKWEEALRVARRVLPGEVQQLLLQQAKAKVAAEDLQGAEEALVEAGREDVAVQLLVRKAKWAAAARLCGRHAPHLLPQVLQQLQLQQQQHKQFKSLQELCEFCHALEQAKAVEEAVDFCLAITDVPPADPQNLRDFWLHAVKLAKGLGGSRHAALAGRVAGELQQMGDTKAAGEVLLSAGRTKEALQCYIAAEDWATAKRLAACLGEDAETAVSLKQRLLLQEKGDITGLLQAGHTDAALLLLADNNEWTKCLQVAAEKESPLFLQLLSRRVHALLETASAAEAAEVLISAMKNSNSNISSSTCRTTSRTENMLSLCMSIASALEVHQQKQQQSSSSCGPPSDSSAAASRPSSLIKRMYLMVLRDRDKPPSFSSVSGASALPAKSHQVAAPATAAAASARNFSEGPLAEAQKQLVRVHLEEVISNCEGQPELTEIAAKAALSVLRYSASSPYLDWLFYRAGLKCRQAGWEGTAFWMLSRYLDICDCIEEGKPTMIDSQLLTDMGLPPLKLQDLPRHHSVTNLQQEQARDLVLGWSVTPTLKPEVQMRKCDGCGASVCMWALTCSCCSKQQESCSVTGFPIPDGYKSCCCACNSHAIAAHLAAYVKCFGACPWCYATLTAHAV